MDRSELMKKVIELQQRANRVLGQYAPESWMNLNLTIAQLKSLFFISSEGKTNFKKLAGALGVTPSNVTGIVDRLVEQGLVSRQENPEDRRVFLLQITEKGETILAKLRESKINQMSAILAHLSVEELSCLIEGFTALVKAAESWKFMSNLDAPRMI